MDNSVGIACGSHVPKANVILLPFAVEKSVKANVATYFRIQKDADSKIERVGIQWLVL